MKLRKIKLGIVFAAAILLLNGCTLKEPSEDVLKKTDFVKDDAAEVTLVMAELNSLDTTAGMIDQKFKEEVEERSNGKMKIDIQPNGVLGSETDVLDTMIGGGGTVDMARITAGALTTYGSENAVLLSLPYTFTSREHFWNFAQSDLSKEFLLEPLGKNVRVRGLFFGEEGFRHFFTKEKITGLESLKNKKLRVADDPIMNGLVNGLGASPTVVSFGELYSALQTGVVDGAEQPIPNYRSNAFNEVAPNLILDGHTLGILEIVIAEDSWDKLTQEQQQIITDAVDVVSEYNRSISEEKENEVLEELKNSKVEIVEIEDKSEWQNAVKDVVSQNIKGKEDLYQQILDMQ